MIKNSLYIIIGNIANILLKSYVYCCRKSIIDQLTGDIKIEWPFVVKGARNIISDSSVRIGPGATIYTTGAKLIFKAHVLVGPNLTIITGDHKYEIRRYIDSIASNEKEPVYDQDVIIEEDVWIGANVTILKGVTVGKSSIIAAGSLVIKDVPAFSVVGGVPAKVLKMKWSESEIIEHKSFLDSQHV